jgi:hypothetical protein
MMLRPMLRPGVACLVVLSLAACAGTPAPVGKPGRPSEAGSGYNQTPPFSRLSYAPFSRTDAIAIALREWRMWGSAVDDDPPGTRPPRGPDQKPERYPGMWERVGEYWWSSQDAGSVFAYWTGKHDGNGQVFPPNQDAHYAWSAAFISYIMRIAGAGDRFPYSAAHATYINAGKAQADAGGGQYVVTAERPERYPVQAGDLICLGRAASHTLTYDELPTTSFPGHCDFVVAANPGQLTVIGGNVDDTVTEKHIPTTPSGTLADPAGTVVDSRYPWFVVLHVAYDQ